MLITLKINILSPFKTQKKKRSGEVLKRYQIIKIGVYKVKIYDNLREKELIRIIRKEKRGKRSKKYYLLETKKVYL